MSLASELNQSALREIPLVSIMVDEQPRIFFPEESLADLAETIKEKGVLQPIIVQIHDPKAIHKTYKLISGERRYRASRLAGMETIPAVIRPDAGDIDRYIIQLYENIHREDLHAIEKARAIKAIILTELAAMDNVALDCEVGEIIRTTLNKIGFKKELSETETVIAGLLAKLKLPMVGGLRRWFSVTVFSDEVQRFFVKNDIPLWICQQLIKHADKNVDEISQLAAELKVSNKETGKNKSATRFISKTGTMLKQILELSRLSEGIKLNKVRGTDKLKNNLQEMRKILDEIERKIDIP